jgi:Tfp pilus assembly protein PilN
VRAVNLLPRDAPVKSFSAGRGVVFTGVGGGALVTVAIVTMMLGAVGVAKNKQRELDGIRAQVAAVPQPAPVDDSGGDAQLAQEKSARVGALSLALDGRVAWDRVLRQVSLVLPEDVWLTNLSAAAPTQVAAAATATPVAGFTLVGSTYSQDGVARFLSRLAVVPDLANVRLVSSQAEADSTRGIVQFTIVADVRTPGSGS